MCHYYIELSCVHRMDFSKIQHEQNITMLLHGKSSILKSKFFPPIVLNPDYSYSLGLNYFTAFHTIHNITEKNNIFEWCYLPHNPSDPNLDKLKNHVVYAMFHPEKKVSLPETVQFLNMEIPPGGYEISNLTSYIERWLKLHDPNWVIQFVVNETTQKMEVKIPNQNLLIDCRNKRSVMSHIFGFSNVDIIDTHSISPSAININDINSINIHANIISGAFVNGKRTHLLHSFVPEAHFGYKICEIPHNIIYHPVNTYEITDVELSIRDERNNLIDFNNEEISICVILKRDGN